MPNRYTISILLFFKNVVRRLEYILFFTKSIISERNFIYLSSILVGISCAFAVILLKSFAHYVFVLATYLNTYLKLPYAKSIFPVIGILLTVLVIKKVLKGKFEKGSSKILYAVAKKGGIMPKKQLYAQIITSSLTVGLGGSAGLESPITITGAAFGSNFAQKYKLSQKDRILLLACGVAAGIGAAFNAPIAGVLFAIEVVLTDIAISAFIPIIISAATGALVSKIMLSEDVLLRFDSYSEFDYKNTPFYIALGILAGLVSVYHARNFRKTEAFFHRFKVNSFRRALIGTSILAVLLFFIPTLFGEGYETIKTLSTSSPQQLLDNTLLEKYKSNEWILLLFVGITALLKSFATGITLGSGGNGGNFAPSLFVGSYLGFFVAKFSQLTGISSHLPIANFTIVGMAGILAGLFHAPLTAIFLIGEITGGYELMVPLMIVSSISFAISKQIEGHSMDVKTLADKGDVYTSNKDKNILQSIDILTIIDTNVETITLEKSLENLVEKSSHSKQELYPVVDEKNKLIGVIDFENVKNILFKPYQVKFTEVKEIMSIPKAVINIEDGVESVIETLENNNQDVAIVLKSGKFYGLVYKIKLLENYRQKLKEMQIE